MKAGINGMQGANVNVRMCTPESQQATKKKIGLLLGEDDGDGVVEDALSEHQHVEDWVQVEGVKDGNGCDGVHGGDQRTEGEATAEKNEDQRLTVDR